MSWHETRNRQPRSRGFWLDELLVLLPPSLLYRVGVPPCPCPCPLLLYNQYEYKLPESFLTPFFPLTNLYSLIDSLPLLPCSGATLSNTSSRPQSPCRLAVPRTQNARVPPRRLSLVHAAVAGFAAPDTAADCADGVYTRPARLKLARVRRQTKHLVHTILASSCWSFVWPPTYK